jgi:catechol 2,3-dioxygenase-like lactoylglutathione lyase family enzyme
MNTAIGPVWGSGVPAEPENIVQGIDHLIVMVRDLDRSQRLWHTLGFAPTPRGFHQSGGTANHLLMLDRTYVELLGVVQPGADSPYRRMAEESPGLWGVALRGSAAQTFSFWRARGLEPSAPASLARGIDIEGRHELARFELTMLPRSKDLPFMLFCCEQLTPNFVWRQDLPPHPNGARALREIFIIDESGAAAAQLARITGRALPGEESDSRFELGECRVSFFSSAAFTRRFGPDAAFRKGAGPMLAGFALLTSDVEAARRFAHGAGWPVRPTHDGGFSAHVPDEGVLIEWAQAR